jgi:hypothetical protein
MVGRLTSYATLTREAMRGKIILHGRRRTDHETTDRQADRRTWREMIERFGRLVSVGELAAIEAP